MNDTEYLWRYVVEHSGEPEGEPRHVNLVKRLLENPKSIGLENVKRAYPEVKFESKHRVCAVNIVYFCPRDMYIVEVKAYHKNTINRHSGSPQLWNAYSIIRSKFDIAPRMIEVRKQGKGNPYQVREISRPTKDIFKNFDMSNLK